MSARVARDGRPTTTARPNGSPRPRTSVTQQPRVFDNMADSRPVMEAVLLPPRCCCCNGRHRLPPQTLNPPARGSLRLASPPSRPVVHVQGGRAQGLPSASSNGSSVSITFRGGGGLRMVSCRKEPHLPLAEEGSDRQGTCFLPDLRHRPTVLPLRRWDAQSPLRRPARSFAILTHHGSKLCRSLDNPRSLLLLVGSLITSIVLIGEGRGG